MKGGIELWGWGLRISRSIPGNEEAQQARMVWASHQHEQAKAQLEQKETPHYRIDAPAPTQGQEVEVVEMGSDIGDAWGRKRALPCQGHCQSLSSD